MAAGYLIEQLAWRREGDKGFVVGLMTKSKVIIDRIIFNLRRNGLE